MYADIYKYTSQIIKRRRVWCAQEAEKAQGIIRVDANRVKLIIPLGETAASVVFGPGEHSVSDMNSD